MKKVFIAAAMVFALSAVLIACGGGDGGDGGGGAVVFTVVFSDNFEYTTSTPWTPSNGWTDLYGGNRWNIVGGGVSGNALQYHTNGAAMLVNSFSGSNNTITVQVKPVNLITGGWPFCLVGRVLNSDNYYRVEVYDDGTATFMGIKKTVGGVESAIGLEIEAYHGHLNSGTWYTLTMTLNGSTITGNLSGGGIAATVTGTDSSFTSGRVGVLAFNNDVNYNALFDNFLVTAP